MAAIRTPGNAGPPDGPPDGAIVHRDLGFDGGGSGETVFQRADLVPEGVDHAEGSYEVRVFFNNTAADEATPRSPEAGTEPLRRALASPAKRLETLTSVPIAKTPRRDRRGLAAGLFKFSRVSLRTYR